MAVKIGTIGPVLGVTTQKRTGILVGMRFDWEDRGVVILDVEAGGRGHMESSTVRVTPEEAAQYKLGQSITIKTEIA